MKRLYAPLVALLLLMAPSVSFAQNYTEMWKKVEQANQKDLPKTTESELQRIIAAAKKQGHTAQLIRALCTRQAAMRAISPDSGKVVIQEIEAELKNETRPVETALWQNALGQSLVATVGSVYSRNAADTASLRRGVQLLKQSVENTELLGRTKTKAYETLFQVFDGSTAVYRDDLLSVMTQAYLEALDQGWYLGMTNGQIQATKREVLSRNLAFYQTIDNRRAAFRVEMQLLDALPYKQRADEAERVRQTYLALPDNVEAYLLRCNLIEGEKLDEAVALAKEGITRYGKKQAVGLVNWLGEKEVPRVIVRWKSPMIHDEYLAFYPGASYQAHFLWNNAQKMELRFYLMKGVRGDDKRFVDQYYSDEEMAKLFKTIPTSLSQRVELDRSSKPSVPKHRQQKDSLVMTAPPAGMYFVELVVDGKRQGLNVARSYTSYLLDWGAMGVDFLENRRKYVDVITGRPNETGDHIYMSPRELRENRKSYANRKPYTRAARAEVFTDRAIYRPGQKVEVSGFYYAQRVDEPYPVTDRALNIKLYDAEDKELETTLNTTDEFGTFVASFQLPKYGRTGVYRVTVGEGTVMAGEITFRVEEYKRPTYTVKLDTLPKRVAVGDAFTVAGSVRTYNNLPVADARVILKRTSSMRWRKTWGGTQALEGAQQDTVTTDAEGRFAHTYKAGEGMEEKMYFWYNFNVEVLAENGETQTAQTYLMVGVEEEKPEKTEAPKVENLVKDDPSRLKVIFRDSAYVYYNLLSDAGQWIESREVEVRDSMIFELEWKPEYGDAALMSLVSVKNGVLTEESFSVMRPEPDKRLLFKWNTFRSELQPGQTEEWTLTVTRPDGVPVSANVMARLYDASLDAFAKKEWSFKHFFQRIVPAIGVSRLNDPVLPFWYTGQYSPLNETSLSFTRWREAMFSFSSSIGALDYAVLEECVTTGYAGKSVRIFGSRKMNMSIAAAPMAAMAQSDAVNIDDLREMQAVGGEMESEAMPEVNLRTNFNETAFFFPRLRTDANGVATLKFTLPESLTQWNFNALAHDKAMNIGLLNETIVARKLLMVEPTLPRFLREGDRIELPATVRNVSGKALKGRLFLDLIDAKTEKVVKSFRQNYHLADGERTTANFTYEVPDGLEGLMVRVVAKSDEFSDGEERIVPVLSRRVNLTHAIPFVVKRGETYDDKRAAAYQRLRAELEKDVKPEFKVDTCRDARNEVAKIVPQLLDDAKGSSVDYATAIYGLELAAALPGYHNMTAEEIESRRAAAIERLLKNQTADGGWSWYPGMQTSPWVTTDVLTLLARIPMLTGQDRYANIREHALRYMDAWMARRVAELRKQKEPSISDLQVRYLYICKLLKRETNDTRAYLLGLAAKENGRLTMLGKSGLALVLDDTKYVAVGKNHLQSVVEYTVASEEMGRYFDTDRALSGWASYRIPTQVYAIEALQRLAGQHGEVAGMSSQQLVDEMQLWLLQSKRTQVWNTSRATADATFALLNAPTANDGLTWGSVSATYSVPAAEAVQKGSGFVLLRRLEVKRGDQWVNVTTNDKGVTREVLQVGDAVRWVYTVTADRDFDHVSIHSSRPAAFESLRPLSGTQWFDGLMAYRMSRDAENEYFIEHLNKGTHTFTEEMRVVRAGRYDAGLATVQCVYAPEFIANSTALIVGEVKPTK